jgi:nucleoside-diphosphate kinase
LIRDIQTGPVLAMVWEGENVIATGRTMIGATNAAAREMGTLRGSFSNST